MPIAAVQYASSFQPSRCRWPAVRWSINWGQYGSVPGIARFRQCRVFIPRTLDALLSYLGFLPLSSIHHRTSRTWVLLRGSRVALHPACYLAGNSLRAQILGSQKDCKKGSRHLMLVNGSKHGIRDKYLMKYAYVAAELAPRVNTASRVRGSLAESRQRDAEK